MNKRDGRILFSFLTMDVGNLALSIPLTIWEGKNKASFSRRAREVDVQRIETSSPPKTGRRTQKQGKITKLPERFWFTLTSQVSETCFHFILSANFFSFEMGSIYATCGLPSTPSLSGDSLSEFLCLVPKEPWLSHDPWGTRHLLLLHLVQQLWLINQTLF